MINIYVSPFGHMREFIEDNVEISLQNPNIAELRKILSEKYKAAASLIDVCVFSDDSHIFGEDEVLGENAKISILPPVCGG